MNKNLNKLFIIRKMKLELNYRCSLIFQKIVMNMMIIHLEVVKTVQNLPNQGLTHLSLIILKEINLIVENPCQIIDNQYGKNI